jgi:nicotinate-nucleotide adenylyltransferase
LVDQRSVRLWRRQELGRGTKYVVVILNGSGEEMNVGVLGGTFNPVHIGHLIVADEVVDRLDLNRLLFIPAGRPWIKANNHILAAEHRLEMLRLAITDKPKLRLSTMEIQRAGLTYTIDTVRELREELNADDELFFILGWDNLRDLPRWRQPKLLSLLCRLVTVPRVGCPVPDLGSLEEAIPSLSKNLIMLDKPVIDISASVIRERVRKGLPINHLVPEMVEKYIEENRLYKY